MQPWQPCCGAAEAAKDAALQGMQEEIDELRDQVDILDKNAQAAKEAAQAAKETALQGMQEVTGPEASTAKCPRQATKCDKSGNWKPGAYSNNCPEGKYCHSTGCQPCPSGQHICDPAGKPHFRTCPNEKHCTPRGCEAGAEQNMQPWQPCCGAAEAAQAAQEAASQGMQEDIDELRDQVGILDKNAQAAKEAAQAAQETASQGMQEDIDELRDQVDILEIKVDKKCPPEPAQPPFGNARIKIKNGDNWYDGEFMGANPGTTSWKVMQYYQKQWSDDQPAKFWETSLGCFDVKSPSTEGYKLVTGWATDNEPNYPFDVTLKKGDTLVWLCGKTTKEYISLVTFVGMSDIVVGNIVVEGKNQWGVTWMSFKKANSRKIGLPPMCVEPLQNGGFRYKGTWRKAE